MVCDIPKIKEKYDIVFSGKGMVAQDGIAIGKVFLYEDGQDLDDFPPGAILVTRHASPKFAMIAKYAAGIITDIGSPGRHMATIAREFRCPPWWIRALHNQAETGAGDHPGYRGHGGV